MSNTFDKLSVLDSFIEEVNSYLPEIEANLARLAQSPGDMEAIEETYRRTHTIGGSASMMDFPGLAHVAHGMEDILGDVLDGLASLDAPTLGLLQRSLARMHQLVQGIRNGVDEDAVIAEDDADYVQYRALLDSSVQQSYDQSPTNGQLKAISIPLPADVPVETPTSSSMPSLDEVLASFRTPSVDAGEEVGWPEETEELEPAPASLSQELEAAADQNLHRETLPSPEPIGPSALEILAASTWQPISPKELPVTPASYEPVGNEIAEQRALQASSSHERSPLVAHNGAELEKQEISFAKAYSAMQEEARSLEVQAFSLKEMLDQLRMTMSLIEAQRTEFKGFLDGSKDALDRMEDWAGQAMGLNLRNSPEQVRRYLPLSVMWVSNTKLKKVLELLTPVTSGVEMTDEQIHTILGQLSVSIEACGNAFQQLQDYANTPEHVLRQEPGWTSWEMQASPGAEAVRERVTFERRGDPEALRAEIEASVRQELRHEYEARPLSVATRAELERQIRNEVRQEFEANRQLQESVSGTDVGESQWEVEARLRSEIEIQVRQEFLDLLTAGAGDILDPALRQSLMPPAPSAPRTSNFVDQARQATGLAGLDVPANEAQENSVVAPPLMSVLPASPPPVAKSLSPAGASPPAAKQPAAPVLPFTGDFGEEAAEIFRLEAEEHLQMISMHVAALEKSPTNRDLIQGIRRSTHTLKGAAAMMGFRAIADLSHISEDLLDSVMEGSTTISPAVLSLILDTAETLDQLITSRESDSTDEEKVQVLRVRYVELLGEHSTTRDAEEDIDVDDVSDESIEGESSVAGFVGGAQPAETNAQRAVRGDLSVRVRLQKLDELVNLFGELLVNRSLLEERIERLVRLVADVGVSSTRLRDVGQKLESRFEAATLPSGHSVQVMPGEGDRSMGHSRSNNGNKTRGPSHLSEFDELELDRYTEFHQLARGLSEGISDMTTLSTEMEAVIRECEGVFARENRLNSTFQDRLMKARLVPLSTMTPRLYRAARAVALKQHKEFEFLLEGEGTEVDRTVNEEIAGPLLHLMRNAVNHAIETPEVRVQKGKPPAGQIKLTAAYEGNQVVITVRDDGVGIDPDRVRNEAIARGLVRPDQMLNDSDVIDLIFRPGFSTAEKLSEESGRGVGLDVVRDSVSRLRGTLEVESTPGQGTAFTMKFPTSLAIQSAMMVRVSGQQFTIPTVMVEAIGRLDNFKRSTLAGRAAVVVQNDLYPLNMLAQLLSLPVNEPDEKAPLLLVNTGGHRVALVVDEIKGKLDVVMKNLGPHLRHVHGVAGGTVMGNGRVVLILELSELLSTRSKLKGNAVGATATTSLRRDPMVISAFQAVAKSPVVVQPNQQSATVSQPPPTGQTEHGKYVLVVDDSPSVRRVVSNMLKQHGWEVQMARDGLEALDMISHETPAAVLLDIEMPRMDGYELIATLRAQEQYRMLPLVVLTSRAAAKHQQRAAQLGASSYVVKPYQDEELINTLNSLVYGAAAR
jgi:chemotaxis protein histidine kinase CheA/ActR/RegA family two-component response regulator